MVVGGDVLKVDIVRYNKILMVKILEQDIEKIERGCGAIARISKKGKEYDIVSTNRPQITHRTLFIRGTNEQYDNGAVYDIQSDPNKMQNTIEAIIELIECVNKEDGNGQDRN